MRHITRISRSAPAKAQDIFSCFKDLIDAPLNFVTCVLSKISGGGGDC